MISANEFKPSGKNYFADLLRYGSLNGAFTEEDKKRITDGLSGLTAERAARLAAGRTSSVKKDVAQKLAESVAFTIGLSLKAKGGATDGIKAIKETDVGMLFNEGLKKAEYKTLAARLAHEKLKRTLIETENYYFNATVKPALDGFFKLYAPEFFAQDIHITADYPVFFGVRDLAGIEFIEKYIDDISTENAFLSRFSSKTIDAVLYGTNKSYKLTPCNLYEPILVAALCSELSFGDIAELDYDFFATEKFFSEATVAETEKSLFAAAERVIAVLRVSDKAADYVRKSVPAVNETLKTAAGLNCLKHVLPATRQAK